MIHLTFDDGPIPELTPYVLDTLEAYSATATFFCVGDNLRKHPAIAKEIVNRGHAIGNHTYHHLDGWAHKTNDYMADVSLFEATYEQLFSTPAHRIFRPPYGKVSRPQVKALKKKGYRIVMWDLLSYDFDPDSDVKRALNVLIPNTSMGSIIVFHDNKKAEKGLKAILPTYLKVFSERGFSFKTLI